MWRPEEELEKGEISSLIKCFELYPSVKVLYNTVQIYRKAIQMKDLETFYNGLKNKYPPRKIPFTIMLLDFEVTYKR
jgi:hypothetical protein